MVIGGWCAVLFGVLAAPLAALSYIELPTFGDTDFHLFGSDAARNVRPLSSLPREQCDLLRAVRDTGDDAYEWTLGEHPGLAWATDQKATADALAAYDFALTLAQREVAVELRDDLRRVDEHVRNGRIAVARAHDRDAYLAAVSGDVFDGYSALYDVRARMGNACGAGFTFYPPSLG